MPRSKSSARWLKEHFDDEFVRRAQAEGLRSRAAFKLDELLDRDRLLKPVLSRPQGGRVEGPGMTVVDLGAAPGGWSQLVRQRLGDAGHVFALDILPMQGIGGGEKLFDALMARLAGAPVDLVLSDIAPNISGIASVDQARAMELAELAADFAYKCLKPGGSFLVKLFQGRGFDEYLRGLRAGFERVTLRKPKASRARSREVYALATGLKREA